MSEAAFNFHLTNPSFWYQKSVSLYASAAIIWEARHGKRDQEFISSLGLKGEFCVDIGCEHPYLMTMGLSYEVILKAICITENKNFPQINHDLQSLANLVDIKFTNTEKDQLLLLSEFIAWEGRYPVPKKHQKPNGSNLDFRHLNFNYAVIAHTRTSQKCHEQSFRGR